VRSGVEVVGALLVVGVGGLAAGVVYDRVVIRPTARNGTIASVAATVGASLIMANGSAIIYGSDGQPFPSIVSGGVRIGGVPITYQSFFIWGVLILVAVSLWLFLGRSRVGQGIVAAANDPLAARASGISVGNARTITFVLGFSLAAVAGVLVAPLTLAGGGLGTTLTLDGFAGAVIGGLASTPGVVYGSLLLGIIQNLSGGWLPNGYEDVIVYALLILSLLVMPTGITGIRRERLA
jgi:branched-subunit amino acid ABC-type transport system permease component